MAFEIAWEPAGVCSRLSGRLSAAEFMRSVEAVQGDERFARASYWINDFSAVEQHELDDEVLTEMGAIHYAARLYNPWCRLAFVGTDPGLTRLLADTLVGSDLLGTDVMFDACIDNARARLLRQGRAVPRTGSPQPPAIDPFGALDGGLAT